MNNERKNEDNGGICPCCGKPLVFIGYQNFPGKEPLIQVHCINDDCSMRYATTNDIIKSWIVRGRPTLIEGEASS